MLGLRLLVPGLTAAGIGRYAVSDYQESGQDKSDRLATLLPA
jgi:hypothetical protein